MLPTHCRNRGDFVARRSYFTMTISNATIRKKEIVYFVVSGIICKQVAAKYWSLKPRIHIFRGQSLCCHQSILIPPIDEVISAEVLFSEEASLHRYSSGDQIVLTFMVFWGIFIPFLSLRLRIGIPPIFFAIILKYGVVNSNSK